MLACAVNSVMATMAFGRPFKPEDPFFDGFLSLSDSLFKLLDGRLLADLFPILEPFYAGVRVYSAVGKGKVAGSIPAFFQVG